MNNYAPVLFILTLLFLTLGIARHYLASMGLPVRWVSIRGILRLLVRIVRATFRALFSLVGWIFRLIQRRRSARPLPHYTTIRQSAFDQSDEE